jgi:hypothetical protein
MRRFATLLAVLGCLTSGAAVAAATPAGTAVGVNPSATDVVANTSRTLVVGSDVALGDRIVTGPTGQVQLIFHDDTHLVVGPSSSLVVESYLLRGGSQSVGKFAVSALGGTFRFITGQSDHSAYTISTPTGTIGVRGTAFDFTVAGLHKPAKPTDFLPGTTVALFKGQVQLCNLAGKCVILTSRCDAGFADTSKTERVGPFQAIDLGLRARFRYIQSERPLLEPFRIRESRLCFINNNQNPGGLSLPSSSPGSAPPSKPPPGRGTGG